MFWCKIMFSSSNVIATEDTIMASTDSPFLEALAGSSKSGKKRTIHDIEHQNENTRVQQ
jgi:hypothetical protein